MQIYAVAHRANGLARMDAAEAVRRSAAAFPELVDGDRWLARSPSGALEVAAVSHNAAVAAPRRYRARRDDVVVLYDGLPVARDGSFPAHDARSLLECWGDAHDRVTGLFSAVRVDLGRDTAECLIDALGLAQVYVHRRRDAWVMSNSVEVIRTMLGLEEPDPLAISSLLSIGWAMGRRSLLAGVEALPGGHVHRFNGSGATGSAYLSPITLAAQRQGPPDPEPVSELADRLIRQARAVGAATGRIRCGVTGGRDTRVLVALLDAAGVDAEYYTVGSERDLDVRIAREIVGKIGGAHETHEPELPVDSETWLAETMRYVVQTDGMAVLPSVGDWCSHRTAPGPLAVRIWGMGGEVGRGGVGLVAPMAATVPGVRSSARLQRWIVHKRLSDHAGVVDPSAVARTGRYLEGFFAARRAEGWPVGELSEAWYAYERMGTWAASGLRRTIATADQYTPFLTRDFVEHSFSLPAGERYLESTHYGLVSCLNPGLRDIPFDDRPWRPQRPDAAAGLALREAAGQAIRRGKRSIRRAKRAVGGTAAPPSHFGHRWIEAGIDHHRELLAGHRDSPLWEFADRGRVERLIAGPPEQRWAQLEGLGRVLTGFWFLYGPRPTATS